MTYLTLLSHDSCSCFFMKQPVHLVIQVLVNRLKFILLSYFWHWTNRLSRGFSLEKFTPKEIAFRKQNTYYKRHQIGYESFLSPTSLLLHYRLKKRPFSKRLADSVWGEIVFVSRRVITVTQHGACSEFRTVKIITKNGHLEPQQFSL